MAFCASAIYIQIALRAHSATVPSTTLVRWLHDVWLRFVIDVSFSFFPYLNFCVNFMSFGDNF